MTKQFSNYSDLLTFTRASKGHALRPVSYGSELVSNGSFDSDTSGWTAGNNAVLSVNSNRLRVGLNVTDFAYASQSFATEAGKIYLIKFNSWGSNQPALWRLGASLTSNNIYQSAGKSDDNFSWHLAFVAQSDTTFLTLYANSTSDTGYAEYDNVSVKEVTFDEPDGTLTLFEHPENVPRVEWDADGNRLGLLVEEARTNLWVFSQDMSQTSFGGAGGTATTDQYVAPDGTQTGDLVTMTSGQVYAYKSVTVSTPTNVAYTVSCYVKAAEANTSVGFRIGEFGGAAVGKFHDSDYTAISSTEWTRLDFTQTLEQSDRTQVQAVIRTTSATGSLLIWGVQLERGSFPTSYIKTTGSTATRSADVASIPVADFGYNQSEGTVVANYYAFAGQGSNNRIAALNDGSISNSIQMVLLDAGTTYHEVRSGGSAGVTTVISGAITDNALTKTALANATDDYAGVTNGGTVGADTSGAMPVGITTLNIGSSRVIVVTCPLTATSSPSNTTHVA